MAGDRSSTRGLPGGPPGGGRGARPLWRSGPRELLFGARGIFKASHLWLPVAVLLLPGLPGAWEKAWPLILAVVCKVQFTILLNDLSDRKADSDAGKNRWINDLPLFVGIAVVFLFLAAGAAAVLLGTGGSGTSLAYAASVFLGASYSLKPARFKERGIAGIFVYGLSSIMIYAVVPWAWLGGTPWTLAFLAGAVGSDKWVQLHFHQVIDFAADTGQGTRTYAVEAGQDRARLILGHASRAASLCLLGLTGYVIFAAGRTGLRAALLMTSAAALAASFVFTAGMKKRRKPVRSALVRELPWFYLGLSGLSFYWLPLVLFIYGAWMKPRTGILAGVSLFLLLGAFLQSLRYKYE